MQGLAIVFLSVAAAIAFGILHDQVTVRVSLEYFTVGHPPVFATQDPSMLALGWGVIATWWCGLILGIPLAAAARVGRLPRRSAFSLVRPVAGLLLTMAIVACLAGLLALRFGELDAMSQDMAASVVPSRRARFVAALWAHRASYFMGFAGGIVLIASVLRFRYAEWRREALRSGRERNLDPT